MLQVSSLQLRSDCPCKMLKFVNSSFRYLTGPLRLRINTVPFKALPFITLFSQLHSLPESSKLASLLSGLELHQQGEEEYNKHELRASSTTSFHIQETTAQLPAGHERGVLGSSCQESVLQISHPWPEWVNLMDSLVKRGYFDEIGSPFGKGEIGSEAKYSNLVRTACLNFGRDRVDLLRHISRKDIRVIVGFQCQSLDRKVVNSGKRLRAYVGIDEGKVCSSCSLRGNCDRAYVTVCEDEAARTVDVMRILLTYSLDHTTGSVEKGECQNNTVEESVRSILREVVGFSQEELDSTVSTEADIGGRKSLRTQGDGRNRLPMKQGDWICPKCNFLNFARNIKCLRCHELFEDRVRQIIEDQDQLPLKKGDWICEKCHFLNFAKNSKCKLCQEKPPKQKLDPGEWECDSCHYINFRKNTLCLRCDHKRPKASASSNSSDNHNTNSHVDGRKSLAESDSKSLIREGERMPRKSWQFVDEKDEDGCDSSQKSSLKFMDFPILGGTSTLSQSKEEREKWKSRMRARSKRMANAEEKSNGLGFADAERPEFLELTDDEEMEGWFGRDKD